MQEAKRPYALQLKAMEAQLLSIIKSMAQDPSLIGDDCAVIELGSEQYLFALDNFVEDVHYSNDYFSVEDIGWKALAINISDIAAMAGQPLFILVGLSLSDSIEDKENWVKDFYTGLNQCAEAFGNPKVIGGDICGSTAKTSISITIVGKATKALMRKSAEPGNLVCVTGSFGETGDFLQDTTKAVPAKHLRPEPRLQEAQALLQTDSQAALMDSSDGLAQALFELAEQNQLELEIDAAAIPHGKSISLEHALYGGEDYELVTICMKAPKGFKVIGKAKPGMGKIYLDGELLTKAKIYRHFTDTLTTKFS
ncbi:MAG: thiamine-phosphate kinase [Candidatus Melainabacteria bacterium]|jgi:thiamine-monophosphate kinase|nr:thiamine-phosphate kinase [Candidatus Melainabacteria bacterium]